MISWIWSRLHARRLARLEAELFVIEYNTQAADHARALASDPLASDARRAHYQRVARIAERRNKLLGQVDTATRYDIVNQWRSRPGALCR